MLRILDDIQAIPPAEYDAIVAALPEWRQKVVSAYKHIENRRESALSFHLLQQMLAKQHGIEEFRFKTNEHGKPSIEGRSDIHFNISHCRNAVACVVDKRPVGVDIERLGRYNERLARHVLSDEELKSVHTAQYDGMTQEEAIDLQFTTLWTQKEAIFKLLGTGITDNTKNLLHNYAQKVTLNTTININKQYVCTTATMKE